MATVTGAYSDFGALGLAALAMTAARRGVTVGDGARRRIGEGLRHLPPPCSTG